MKNLFTLLLLIAPLCHATQPNFVFLLSDDQDWTGLSVPMHPDVPESKSPIIETKNIAQLAHEGMRFSAAYAPASVCSPTRISLQTGKSPAQLHWTKAAPSVTADHGYKMIGPTLKKSIAASETTIAELLKELGYATAHYGKWHITGGGPGAHGYDESDGDTGNNDAAPHKDPNPVDIFGMGERASAFMAKSAAAKKPFFIQLSYHALHYPENASAAATKKYQALYPRGNAKEIGRAAISDDLDRGVGLLMQQIDQLNLSDNTYVIYMSDNGGGGRSKTRPLTGGKGSVWEGGIRVPLIMRGPGIAANSWCHQRVVGFDLLPTLYTLAGGTEPLPTGIEGGDFSHLLKGESGAVKRAHEALVFHFPHYQSADGPHSAILLGDYKLIHFFETGENKLFKISEDLKEQNDLADAHPERAAALSTKLETYLRDINAQLPTVNPNYDADKAPRPQQKGKKQPKQERRRTR